jgi:hypothetical protein
VHLHNSSKKNDIKKSQNRRNQGFSYYFYLMIWKDLCLTDPDADPEGRKTYGSYGSGSATLIFTKCFAKAPFSTFSHAHHYLEGNAFFSFRIFQPTWQNNLSRSWQHWWFVQVHDSASSAQTQNNAATPALEELPAPGFWEIFHYGVNHAGLITGRIEGHPCSLKIPYSAIAVGTVPCTCKFVNII